MSVIRDFADLPLRDSSVEFGDSSANRIDPFLASELGLGSIGAVIVEMGGSGGVDNLVFNEISAPVPEPATGALLGLGILFALVPRRRR